MHLPHADPFEIGHPIACAALNVRLPDFVAVEHGHHFQPNGIASHGHSRAHLRQLSAKRLQSEIGLGLSTCSGMSVVRTTDLNLRPNKWIEHQFAYPAQLSARPAHKISGI